MTEKYELKRMSETGKPRIEKGQHLHHEQLGWLVVVDVSEPEKIIDGLSTGLPIDDGWICEYSAKEATPREEKKFEKQKEIEQLKRNLRTLSAPPDDDRDRRENSRRQEETRAELEEARAELKKMKNDTE